MDERISRVAALSNAAVYDSEGAKKYLDGAPHIKHASLRNLYGILLVKIFDYAKLHSPHPTVLDLGAGEGSVTLPFLELGANVVAVDISQAQLDALRKKCKGHEQSLELRCQDVQETLTDTRRRYDIVVANSFLHHIPDYISAIRQSIALLNPHGQFFSFQDPLRYDSLSRWSLIVSRIAYFSWRITKGDVINGLRRRIRRSRGIFLPDSPHDNAEFHATRNGVDQDAISSLLLENDLECDIIRYFSAHSSFFQPFGAAVGLSNTFAVIGRKTS